MLVLGSDMIVRMCNIDTQIIVNFQTFKFVHLVISIKGPPPGAPRSIFEANIGRFKVDFRTM